MRLWNHEKERFLEKLDRKQVDAFEQGRCDDQIYTPGVQLLEKHRRRVLDYIYRDAGVLAEEGAKYRGQKVRRDRGRWRRPRPPLYPFRSFPGFRFLLPKSRQESAPRSAEMPYRIR